MKLLLLPIFCCISFCAFAQVPDTKNPWTMQLPDSLLKRFKGNNNEVLKQKLQDYMQRKHRPNQLLADKMGNVAILPQDHMPCVVPDTNAIASMPNAWSEVTNPYRATDDPIPNPALPLQSFKYNEPDNSKTVPSK